MQPASMIPVIIQVEHPYLGMVVQLAAQEVAPGSLVGQHQEKARLSHACGLHDGQRAHEGADELVMVRPRVKAL